MAPRCIQPFVIYANWEPAPLHAYATPVDMTILRVNGSAPAMTYATVKQQVEALNGVTACAANASSKVVSVTFDPEHISAARISSEVAAITRQKVEKAVFETAGPPAPQCPIPHSYIRAFEKAKYALCFR
ncbi:MAG: hypothetical protein MUE30_11280 [Spirosomaceae bacterium]|nr:hypothetical protein [Spirosomataceae bacterium]